MPKNSAYHLELITIPSLSSSEDNEDISIVITDPDASRSGSTDEDDVNRPMLVPPELGDDDVSIIRVS